MSARAVHSHGSRRSDPGPGFLDRADVTSVLSAAPRRAADRSGAERWRRRCRFVRKALALRPDGVATLMRSHALVPSAIAPRPPGRHVARGRSSCRGASRRSRARGGTAIAVPIAERCRLELAASGAADRAEERCLDRSGARRARAWSMAMGRARRRTPTQVLAYQSDRPGGPARSRCGAGDCSARTRRGVRALRRGGAAGRTRSEARPALRSRATCFGRGACRTR